MPDAVWFAAPRHVEIRSEPMRTVGPRDVRVRTIVSGISAGSELLVYRGEAPADLAPDLPTVEGGFGLPMKFGYASVGAVVEAGNDVARPAVGDLVFAHHPHQTEFVVPADFPVSLPEGPDPEIGSFTANLETALTVALDANVRTSESVLVTGQGVVGLLIAMLLRRGGIGQLVTADLHELRRRASARAGADHAVEAASDLAERVMELTQGRGVDVAIEASGSPAALQACIDAVAFGGTVVVGSWYGTRAATLRLGGAFHRRRVRIVSSQVSTLDPSLGPRWTRERRTEAVRQLLCELPLAGLVTHRFPLRDAAAAYELLDERPHECLQVVLDHV